MANSGVEVLSLFDGMSCARLALDRAGVPVAGYYASEIDRDAIVVASRNHPADTRIGDVKSVSYADGTLRWDGGSAVTGIDLLVGGSPCFAAGTLVLTKDGHREIESVRVGDMVLTHKGRWKKVTACGSKMSSDTYLISANGSPAIVVTGNHPFFVREHVQVRDPSRGSMVRELRPPAWKKAEDIRLNDSVGFKLPTEKAADGFSEGWWWLVGRYLADGYLSKRKNRGPGNGSVVFCVGKAKKDAFVSKTAEYVFSFGHAEERTALKFRMCSSSMFRFLRDNFGKGAAGKHIPGWVLGIPLEKRKALLEGYLSGDGNAREDGWKATTVSKKLALSIALLSASVTGKKPSVYFLKKKSTCVIEGRVCNQRDVWEVNLPLRNRVSYVDEDGYFWGNVRKKERLGLRVRVYNLSVEDDESYTADNVIVHNCQDLSISKKGRDGLGGSRSGLFYEYARLLRESRPAYFILENVASMPKAAKDEITRILGVEPVMIDAALVSAQTRKRLFWVGRREGDGYATVPVVQPMDRCIRLKDVLLPETYTEFDKAYALTASYNKAVLWNSVVRSQRTMVWKKPIRVGQFGNGGQGQRVYSIDGKSVTLSAHGGGMGAKTGLYAIKDYARKLEPVECERLQGVPDGYTEGVSKTARRKLCGNAFNVDVVAHIIRHFDEDFRCVKR